MNIRDHLRAAINDGLLAEFAQRDGKAGALFHDEGEFIAFDDLNVNQEYGYYRLSQFPDLQRDCTNENPETLHRGKDFGDDWKPLVWADSGGNLTLIGDPWQAANLYQALSRYLFHGETDPEEIGQDDPSWEYMKRIDWAVKEYRDFLDDDRPDAQIANTIRAAATRGAIHGCSQSETGAWYFRPIAFRGWLVKTRDETRGKPRGKFGDPWQAADLYQALSRYLFHGETDPEEIGQDDPSWDYMKRIDWAVKEYRDFLDDDRPDAQIANTIRAAATRGAIHGCSQSETGAWYFRPIAFRGWLVKTRDETRGKPRGK